MTSLQKNERKIQESKSWFEIIRENIESPISFLPLGQQVSEAKKYAQKNGIAHLCGKQIMGNTLMNYAGKGIYIIDYPKIDEAFSELSEDELEKRLKINSQERNGVLFSEDGLVRRIDYPERGVRYLSHEAIPTNSSLLGLYGSEDYIMESLELTTDNTKKYLISMFGKNETLLFSGIWGVITLPHILISDYLGAFSVCTAEPIERENIELRKETHIGYYFK